MELRCPVLSIVSLVVALSMVDATARGQGAPGYHSIEGQVIDAASGEPLPGSVVLLTSGADGFLGRPGASIHVPTGWSTVTDDRGAYGFPRLPAGSYTLFVSRFAYESTRVQLDLAAAGAQLSVGLVVDPIAMEPQHVVVPATDSYAGARLAGDPIDRVTAERDRQRRFLESDARIIGYGDVVDAVTLAETDLFRAFQRLPGVSTRDDYTAELWTRGAPWSHTRITFDGLPLYSPLHGAGSMSGVNMDAVGAAFFHPGVRSVAHGEGAAAVINLASRPATTSDETHGRAELSLLSARAAFDRRLADDRVGWMVAARRSHLDLVSRAIVTLGGDEDVRFPYDFHDLVGRLDVGLNSGHSLETSAMWEQDAVRGEIPELPETHRARWGNSAGRVTLESPLGRVRLRHTLGATRFYARGLDAVGSDSVRQSIFNGPGEDPTASHIVYVGWQGEVTPAAAIADDRWQAGYSLTTQRQRYVGPAPTPYPGRTSLRRDSLHGEVDVVSAWVERRWPITDRTQIETGLRLETGSRVADLAPLRAAPRISARHRIGLSQTFASVGYLRSYQYAQVLAPVGIAVGPRLHPSDQWLLANDSLPALRSDIVTLGTESWIRGRWLVSMTGYFRRVAGFATPLPVVGEVSPEAGFAVGTNTARGLELSARRLIGRWTGSMAYTLGSSRLDVDGQTFAAATDRRQIVDASVITRATERLRVGAAFTWASGAPFTRFFAATIECPQESKCVILTPARVEAPNAERTDAYASLDALIEWTRPREKWDLTFYGQVRNVLNRENAITYRGSEGAVDRFTAGIPFLPAVGIRLTF